MYFLINTSHKNIMGIKFLTFLGTNNYSPTHYKYQNQAIEYIDEKLNKFVQRSVYNVIKCIVNQDPKYSSDGKKISTYVF